jgi:alkylhydroperoxidase family enzyme
MAWIKTINYDAGDENLRAAMDGQRATYPAEYAVPVHPTAGGGSSEIVASHSLIPDALYHAFATFGSLMAPELPLSRVQHEMIATLVSSLNRCHY